MTYTKARHFCRQASVFAAATVLMSGCAVQSPPVQQLESSQGQAAQVAAQRAGAVPAVPTLKRKIALGRITNETNYGQSLLRDRTGDPLGKQVTDLLSKGLTESGAFLVLERPDVSRILDEADLTGSRPEMVGVDALVIGSLTEFGRKTLGQSGFVSSSKRQVAFAKIDLRLVDVKTGHVFFSTSGAGEATTETASTFGFGSTAGYDGTLNDAAVRQAVSEVVSRLTTELSDRPWQTFILSSEAGRLYIAGGRTQGVRPGMIFSVQTSGQRVKSPQTGFEITLPGQEVAQVRIESNFGETETTEGSVGILVAGSLDGYRPDQLLIRAR